MPAVDALPAAGECHLWSVPVRTRPEWETLLAPDEAARAAAMPGGGRRDLLVTSRAAQRLVAHRYTGRPAGDLRIERTCPRCGAGHGRPRVVHGGYDYSVTHTRHRVLIAVVTQGLVGIDLDTSPYPGVPRRLIARTATPGERAALTRLPAREVPEAFTRLWSRKEAVAKLTGHGLAARLNRIEVRGDLARPEGSPAQDWPAFPIHLRDARVEGGRIAAIASTCRITALEPRSLSAPAATRNARFA
ncbi:MULTISPECIES: 4'-phosphopantetheinyl transferase family protein [Streptomyces]|uniref:4'-phosphopantetheinyl transferase family protein n=1 Tax=Streptomyces TaxID=1883 RepID=UPI0016760238|nr:MULTISPECIES: 4'-phosphopantetheinyl transferase superfamily protein [Streptomyces]MBK3523664.1 4'-phosphopantetheinyl transferase superfamily protein [Streptomyces sp. MBT70]GGR78682.1 4'-phosphopantetheinyl transferase [Streptomyces eurythermus]